jgi:hypothetical protein
MGGTTAGGGKAGGFGGAAQAARKISGSSTARRAAAGTKISHVPAFLALLISLLVQNTRYAQDELWNLDIELRAVVGMHPVVAAHRADLRG